MKNTIRDERIAAESNKIFKICFYLLCSGIFIDLAVKFNLIGYIDDTVFSFWTWGIHVFVGIEFLFLSAIFYTVIFTLAKRGILIGCENVVWNEFPAKRYAAITAVLSAIFSVCMWTLRFCIPDPFYAWYYYLAAWAIFVSLTFVFVYGLLYLVFFLAYVVADKHNRKIIESDEE